VKSEADRERLWRGVASGEIAFVTTDHAAGEWPREKQTGSAWSDYGGIPGTQTLLPYMYSEGYRAGRMTLERLVEVLCRAPATFFGARQRKGHLASGLDADFVVIDESDSWTVSGADLRGMNRYTPFEGQTFQGRVVGTWVRGARVYAASNEVIQDPVTVEAGWGELLRASR
jgi:dihydroorotase-like cyclic amidohydrolase